MTLIKLMAVVIFYMNKKGVNCLSIENGTNSGSRLIQVKGNFTLPTFITTAAFKKAFKDVSSETHKMRMSEMISMISVLVPRLETNKHQKIELPTGQILFVLKKEQGRVIIDVTTPSILKLVRT